MRKFAIIGFAVELLVTSLLLWQHFKHPSDAKLTQAVSGSWIKGSTVLVMAHDGSFSESFQFPKGTLTLAGTWQIKDGILICHVPAKVRVPFGNWKLSEKLPSCAMTSTVLPFIQLPLTA